MKFQPKLIKAEGDKPHEILVHGPIGKSFWSDEGISGKEFIDALDTIPVGQKVTVGVNSQGGAVGEGLAIFNAIDRRKDDVTVRIDGYALSIASFFPLAASKVVSPKTSIWMIHEAWSVTQGNKTQMRKDADMLETHDAVLAGVYAKKTGKPLSEIESAMAAETWLTGEQAIQWGLADLEGDNKVSLDAFDFSAAGVKALKNIPAHCTHILAALANGEQSKQQPQGKSPVTASATISPETKEVETAKTEPQSEQTTKGQHMPEEAKKTAEAAPVTPPADSNIVELTSLVKDLAQEVKALKTQPVAQPRVEITREGLNDLLKTKGNAKAQSQFLAQNWNELTRNYPVFPSAANTDSASGALTTAILSTTVITTLQNRLAALNAFARNLAQGRIGRNVIQVPHVTAGGTAQSNPTSFQDTTNFVSTVGNVAITPAHIVSGAHLTNAELQNGWQIQWFAEVKAGEFCDKIQALINAIITTTNFTADPVTSAAASFGAAELKTLWGTIKKASVKNIILDGEYFAQFLPDSMEDYSPLNGNRYPGWDGFFLNTYWAGATENTVGFACNPQAIGVGAGLPLEAPNMIGAGNLAETVITLPESGMQASNFMWFDPSTRNIWWTLEAMFGAAKGDATAGVLVKSA